MAVLGGELLGGRTTALHVVLHESFRPGRGVITLAILVEVLICAVVGQSRLERLCESLSSYRSIDGCSCGSPLIPSDDA